MMSDKAKVLLTVFAATMLMSSCSLFRHIDAPTSENINTFETGSPSLYEKERDMLIEQMKKQREDDIIANRNRAWENENRPVVGVINARRDMPEIEESPVVASSSMPKETDMSLSEPLVIAAVVAISDSGPKLKTKPKPAIAARRAMKKRKPATAIDPGEPRIKIVSGDGMPLSAKRLSKNLKGKGYNIDRVDVAPYIFDKPVVFYAPQFRDRAKTMAKEINATGSIKPLSWQSIYDIIIVSVNRY